MSPKDAARLQRLMGNRAVTSMIVRSAADPSRTVHRLALVDGPPLAPGNYRYGNVIVSLEPKPLRSALEAMAGKEGLPAERKWVQAFIADMWAQDGKHKYEDPSAKQTVNVEATLADRAQKADTDIVVQVGAVQTQFQQQLLTTVGGMLSSSEQKLEAEGRRYGFPDTESIFRPKPVSAGAAAIGPSMPGSDDLRGMMSGAKQLLDGKKKLAKARATISASGPILGDAMRPTLLEPAVKEYHDLRQKVCTGFPLLASIERNDDRLAKLASGAANAKKGQTGPAASIALVKAKEQIRKELADKLSNVAVVKDGMKAQDKIDKFWLDPALRANTKRSLGIAASTVQDAAVEEKVKGLKEDAEFEASLKTALGVGLLIASFIPGVAPVAGAVGLIVAGVDIVSAFQEFYWQQAASGTAMEKAEAISQSDPSLYGLAVSIAFGLLEGVAEVKALEGAINVFKVVRNSYREAKAAGVAAKLGSGTAKAGAASELVQATEKLKTTTDTASGKAGLGDQVVASLGRDVDATAKSLDRSLKAITDPGLKQLVLQGKKPVTKNGETLMDLAIKDPHELAAEYKLWQESKSGKPFEDYLADQKGVPSHGILNEPAGLTEYGLNEAEARRSFDAAKAADPTREVGIWKDPATGEYVVVQGGPGFVEQGWEASVDNMRGGKIPKWTLELHHHPNRGIAIDRIPSPGDFGNITRHQRAGDAPKPVTSAHTWVDPTSKITFTTEFGFVPRAERPYWSRYRVDDGTMRIASFKERPGTTSDYQSWVSSFTGKPTDVVPGGNVMPVAAPLPPPPVPMRPPLAPPPLPRR